MLKELRVYNRALASWELEGLMTDVTPTRGVPEHVAWEASVGVTPSAPVTGLIDLCTSSPPPPPSGPPVPYTLVLNVSADALEEPVSRELLGHDLEFTRHDLYEGLAAEMLANRKFAVPTPCG